jgi:hypothetical protein
VDDGRQLRVGDGHRRAVRPLHDRPRADGATGSVSLLCEKVAASL